MNGSRARKDGKLRVMWWLQVTLAVGAGLFGVWGLLWWSWLGSAATAYLAEPMCAQSVQALSERCWTRVPIVIVATSSESIGWNNVVPTVTADWNGHLFIHDIIVNPPQSYFEMKAGDRISGRIDDGYLYVLYTRGNHGMRTTADPLNDPPLTIALGASALGISLAMTFLLWTDRYGRADRSPKLQKYLWSGTIVERWHASWSFRIVIGALVLASGLDIVTTLQPAIPHYYEANGIIVVLGYRIGPLLAIVLAKLPVVILLTLIVSRLEERLMIIIGWIAALLTGLVAAHNALLYHQVRNLSVTGGGGRKR